MKVEEVMTKDVATVMPETPVKEVARLLVERHVSGVPVVDRDGRVLGVVSGTDILLKERGSTGRRGGLLARLAGRDTGEAKARARVASEAMSSPAIEVSPAASVAEAAGRMIDHGVDRLVVVQHPLGRSDEGRLVGIVSRSDLVRAFAREDAELELEIRTALERDFGVFPGQVQVSVAQGEVRLAGQVDFKMTAELIESAAARVPGVVEVQSELTWRLKEPERAPSVA